MRRTPIAFLAALGLTFIVALLPTRWLGWVNDLSSIVRLPVAPLGDLGNSAARLFRPPAVAHADLEPQTRELVTDLEQQRDQFERLYHAADQRVAELEEQLQQLQQVPVESLSVPVTRLLAQITTRHPGRSDGPVQLNRGARHGVERNSIAVYQGVHILGRIGDVTNVASSLHPLTNPATGLIRAAIFPSGAEEASVHEAAKVALRPTGEGTFLADVASEHAVQTGDTVRLFDPAWPDGAQAMIIGNVTDVRRKDDQPLRNEVVITPRFTVSQLADVTLIVEERDVLRNANAAAGDRQ